MQSNPSMAALARQTGRANRLSRQGRPTASRLSSPDRSTVADRSDRPARSRWVSGSFTCTLNKMCFFSVHICYVK